MRVIFITIDLMFQLKVLIIIKSKDTQIIIAHFTYGFAYRLHIKIIKKNIGVMKHVKSCIPKESLAMLYKTLVEPYLRYCNTRENVDNN